MSKILSSSHKEHIREGMVRYWDRKRKPRKQKNGYETITIGNKKKYFHRFLMEEKIGRELKPFEQVHHINGDRTDNRIENLEIVHIGEHQKHHAKLRGFGGEKGRTPPNKTSAEMQETIKLLRKKGFSLREISRITKVGYVTVQKYAKEVNL